MTPKPTAPQGIYRDRLLTAGGEVVERDWRSNLVVDGCRVLLAGFMKGDDPQGIQTLLVGRGDPSWDLAGIPAPRRVDTAPVDPDPFELPVTADQIVYLDAAGAVSAQPTPRLELTLTLEADQPPLGPGETTFPLREFALFGSFDGTATMINSVRHPVLHKAPGDVLTRTVRLVF
jgi:hypothetical protein